MAKYVWILVLGLIACGDDSNPADGGDGDRLDGMAVDVVDAPDTVTLAADAQWQRHCQGDGCTSPNAIELSGQHQIDDFAVTCSLERDTARIVRVTAMDGQGNGFELPGARIDPEGQLAGEDAFVLIEEGTRYEVMTTAAMPSEERPCQASVFLFQEEPDDTTTVRFQVLCRSFGPAMDMDLAYPGDSQRPAAFEVRGCGGF